MPFCDPYMKLIHLNILFHHLLLFICSSQALSFKSWGVGGLTSFFYLTSNNQYYTTIIYFSLCSIQSLIIVSSIDLKKIVNSIFILFTVKYFYLLDLFINIFLISLLKVNKINFFLYVNLITLIHY